ncbi:hypothetical protein CNEO4_1110009 [Clostridium neonatale]|nr:hypothetical protein CNEO4_1110009 [Clostridium neonatale]
MNKDIDKHVIYNYNIDTVKNPVKRNVAIFFA